MKMDRVDVALVHMMLSMVVGALLVILGIWIGARIR